MSDTSSHKPKNVLIGGIYGGIGRALARRLSRSGWKVTGFGSDPAKLESVAEELDGIQVFSADATHPEEIGRAFVDANEAMGGMSAYVHCIGSVFLKPAHLTSPEEWRETLGKNLDSAFFALRAGVPLFQKQGGGAFVFCSSVAAGTGLVNHEAVAAAKGGLEGMVRSAAATYAPRHIRVNAVALGLVETGATQAILGNPQARMISEQMHPLGRVGQPDDAASLLAWLASDEASWVTGQIYAMDGGMGAIVPRPKISRS
jgi:NAD(P)-dependent dehydrogenase (short-subunit alcohol dehydrogenase family)